MKLKFDPSLEFQRNAVNAAASVFEGLPLAQTGAEAFQSIQIGGMFQNELGMGNNLSLPDDVILENVRKIQEANGIEKVSELQGREFSIEMETGTGKTYVYLRTIFELSKIYGLRKFIIVVPSVAVREGVMKSIDITKNHFRALYGNAPFNHFIYDSKRLGQVRQFASGGQIQIMVINIQAFVKGWPEKPEAGMTVDELKKINLIHRESEKMSGRRPIEFIQSANPVVIIDEPQSVDNTEKAKTAVASLNPAASFRYSATHRTPYNLLYKLGPIEAYDLQLVKRIEVSSVRSESNFNDAYVKFVEADWKTKFPRARIEFYKNSAKGPKLVKALVNLGDDLFQKSGELYFYRDGYVVQEISRAPRYSYIEFRNGQRADEGAHIGGAGDEIMKAQVYETVEQHLHKENALKSQGIKVLSLFFIDRVANYRVHHDDGSVELGKIGQWFEDAYAEITARPAYKGLIPFPAAEVHGGYFAQDKKGRAKDTRGDSKDDEGVYELIMRDKERLLDSAVPLRFIFSHSALREGWDNPNVFQICTLNETRSAEKKRQEIGRGLRLPVNSKGERVHDENINRLTVIANESYEDFARTLQTEFEEDCGIVFGKIDIIAFSNLVRPSDEGETPIGQEESEKIWRALAANGYLAADGSVTDKFDPANEHFVLALPDEFTELRNAVTDVIQSRLIKNRVLNAKERREVKFNKRVYLDPEFAALWDKIKHRTRYRVRFDTDNLIAAAAGKIKALAPVETPRLSVTRVGVDIDGAGVQTDRILGRRTQKADAAVKVLPDLLGYLQDETGLTRRTLFRIMKQSGKLPEFKVNPQAFMSAAAGEIKRALHSLMLDGVKYEKISDREWAMSRLEPEDESEISRYLKDLQKIRNKDKSLFDYIKCDSEVEKNFARELDNHENVRLFVKLPRWFKIDTPVGAYNPDWAFVTEREEKLYFVRETKKNTEEEELRITEDRKTKFGKRHFEALDVDFDVVTSLKQVKF